MTPPLLPVIENEAEAAALAAVRAYCGWHVAPVTDSGLIRVEETPKSRFQLLPTRRLVELTQVLVDGQDVTAQTRWSESGAIELPMAVPNRLGCLQARMRHGFEWEQVADVVAVVRRVAARAEMPVTPYRSQSAGPFSYTTHTVNGAPLGGVALLEAEKAMLDRFKLEWGP